MSNLRPIRALFIIESLMNILLDSNNLYTEEECRDYLKKETVMIDDEIDLFERELHHLISRLKPLIKFIEE